jgi:hypothetical protein
MSGNAGDNGVKTTTINVQTIIDNQTAAALHSGRRSAIVTKILLQMDILPINMLVSAMPAIETQLPQMQDDFNFLVGLARKWGCHFKLTYDERGFLHAAFCAANELGSFAESIGGTGFFAIKLYYGVFKAVGAPIDLSYRTQRDMACFAGCRFAPSANLWQDIAQAIVAHIQQNAVVTVQPGITITTTGTAAAQTGATTAHGTGSIT